MIALGGPKLKLAGACFADMPQVVSMIALGGPKLKRIPQSQGNSCLFTFQ